LVGWIEMIRMINARWWPHWGALAPKINALKAARTAFPVHLRVLAGVAVTVFVAITSCDTFAPGRQPSSGWEVGVFAGIVGSFIGAYGGWYIRVLEPFDPILPSQNS
jgi:hypothetical protein